MKDYYLQMEQTQLQSTLDVEAYPKAGHRQSDRRRVCVYDLAARRQTRASSTSRDGKPFTNDVVGHYVYDMTPRRWSPDGTELLMNRTNRRQNIMEFAACNPATGEVPRDHPRGMADRLGG